MSRLRCRVLFASGLFASLVAGLSVAESTSATTPPTTSPGAATEVAPLDEPSGGATIDPVTDDEIDGLFDVGGHRLYLNCRGTGSPTVIHLHGAIWDPIDPHASGQAIQDLLADDVRVCVYDRRNLGHSDTVDDVQEPAEVLADLHNLLAAAEVDPPYVLLGASFGGIVAYLYANNYPDEVVGMVLLDAMFPDEMSLDHLFPPDQRFEAFDSDEDVSLERISHYDMQMAAQEFIGREPTIEVTYITAEQEPWNVNDYGIPEYDAQILDVLASYVDRFSPGKLTSVDAPHFMEVVAAEEIAAEVRDLIALTASGSDAPGDTSHGG